MVTIIIIGVIILMTIAFTDYLWFGKKLLKETPLSAKHLIMFYFGRSLAELIIFMFGILLGWRLSL